jgi:hypothetical protein
MKITFDFKKNEIENARNIYFDYKDRILTKRRIERNIKKKGVLKENEQLWRAHIICLLTSQQKSGPSSAINKFSTSKIKKLSLSNLRKVGSIKSYVKKELKSFGGIRYYNRIGEFCESNYPLFQEGIIKRELENLKNGNKELERIVADELASRLKGFGPKQSRNFLQMTGNSFYEIPIDSRIVKWMTKNLHLGYFISAQSLNDIGIYHLLNDMFIELCQKINCPPCVFDACVFSSFDKIEDSGNEVIF